MFCQIKGIDVEHLFKVLYKDTEPFACKTHSINRTKARKTRRESRARIQAQATIHIACRKHPPSYYFGCRHGRYGWPHACQAQFFFYPDRHLDHRRNLPGLPAWLTGSGMDKQPACAKGTAGAATNATTTGLP